MTRAERKRKEKEACKIEQLFDNFIIKYMNSVTRCRDDSAKSLQINNDELKVKQNHEFQISNINILYQKVWRGVVEHTKKNYELAELDTNKFSEYMVWK